MRWPPEPAPATAPGPSRRVDYISPIVHEDYESPRAYSPSSVPRSPSSSFSSRSRSRSRSIDRRHKRRRSPRSIGRVDGREAREYGDQRQGRENRPHKRTPRNETQRVGTRTNNRSRPDPSRDLPAGRFPQRPVEGGTPIVITRDKGKQRATQVEAESTEDHEFPAQSLPTSPTGDDSPPTEAPKARNEKPPRTRHFRLKDLVQAHLVSTPRLTGSTPSSGPQTPLGVTDVPAPSSSLLGRLPNAPSPAPVREADTARDSAPTLSIKGAARASSSLSAPQIMARTRARLAELRNTSVAGVQPSAIAADDTSSPSPNGPSADSRAETPSRDAVRLARDQLLSRLEHEKRSLHLGASDHTGTSPPATGARATADGNHIASNNYGIDGEGTETGDASAAMEARLRSEASLRVRLAAEKRAAAEGAHNAEQTDVCGGDGSGSAAATGLMEGALRARLQERRR
jgi:hypothetical protein